MYTRRGRNGKDEDHDPKRIILRRRILINDIPVPSFSTQIEINYNDYNNNHHHNNTHSSSSSTSVNGTIFITTNSSTSTNGIGGGGDDISGIVSTSMTPEQQARFFQQQQQQKQLEQTTYRVTPLGYFMLTFLMVLFICTTFLLFYRYLQRRRIQYQFQYGYQPRRKVTKVRIERRYETIEHWIITKKVMEHDEFCSRVIHNFEHHNDHHHHHHHIKKQQQQVVQVEQHQPDLSEIVVDQNKGSSKQNDYETTFASRKEEFDDGVEQELLVPGCTKPTGNNHDDVVDVMVHMDTQKCTTTTSVTTPLRRRYDDRSNRIESALVNNNTSTETMDTILQMSTASSSSVNDMNIDSTLHSDTNTMSTTFEHELIDTSNNDNRLHLQQHSISVANVSVLCDDNHSQGNDGFDNEIIDNNDILPLGRRGRRRQVVYPCNDNEELELHAVEEQEINDDDEEEEERECPVCMCSFVVNDIVSWSANSDCKHVYHHECIKEWLLRHTECCMCKTIMLPVDEKRNHNKASNNGNGNGNGGNDDNTSTSHKSGQNTPDHQTEGALQELSYLYTSSSSTSYYCRKDGLIRIPKTVKCTRKELKCLEKKIFHCTVPPSELNILRGRRQEQQVTTIATSTGTGTNTNDTNTSHSTSTICLPMNDNDANENMNELNHHSRGDTTTATTEWQQQQQHEQHETDIEIGSIPFTTPVMTTTLSTNQVRNTEFSMEYSSEEKNGDKKKNFDKYINYSGMHHTNSFRKKPKQGEEGIDFLSSAPSFEVFSGVNDHHHHRFFHEQHQPSNNISYTEQYDTETPSSPSQALPVPSRSRSSSNLSPNNNNSRSYSDDHLCLTNNMDEEQGMEAVVTMSPASLSPCMSTTNFISSESGESFSPNRSHPHFPNFSLSNQNDSKIQLSPSQQVPSSVHAATVTPSSISPTGSSSPRGSPWKLSPRSPFSSHPHQNSNRPPPMVSHTDLNFLVQPSLGTVVTVGGPVSLVQDTFSPMMSDVVEVGNSSALDDIAECVVVTPCSVNASSSQTNISVLHTDDGRSSVNQNMYGKGSNNTSTAVSPVGPVHLLQRINTITNSSNNKTTTTTRPPPTPNRPIIKNYNQYNKNIRRRSHPGGHDHHSLSSSSSNSSTTTGDSYSSSELIDATNFLQKRRHLFGDNRCRILENNNNERDEDDGDESNSQLNHHHQHNHDDEEGVEVRATISTPIYEE